MSENVYDEGSCTECYFRGSCRHAQVICPKRKKELKTEKMSVKKNNLPQKVIVTQGYIDETWNRVRQLEETIEKINVVVKCFNDSVWYNKDAEYSLMSIEDILDNHCSTSKENEEVE